MTLSSTKSNLFVDHGVEFHFKKDSQLIINEGILKVGGPHPRSIGLPSLGKTIVVLEEGSKIIVDGDCYIASGSYISLRKGSIFLLKGKNYIGNDNKIIVARSTTLGMNVSTSWNVTLMEDDGHEIFHISGRAIKMPRPPMRIGDNVGIQMNVTIPRGVTVGDNALIGANTVIRKDIAANTLVYTENTIREKYGYSAGLQFS